jgi:hypothetical protein
MNNEDYSNISLEKKQAARSYSFAAAIVLILAGLIALLTWLPFLIGQEQIITLFQQNFENLNIYISLERIRLLLTIIGSIEIIISLLVIISGILALRKIRWGIAILFSLLGFFTIGMLFISSVLSIIGLVLLFLSKHEFK